MNVDRKLRITWPDRAQARLCIRLSFGLILLSACGAPDRVATGPRAQTAAAPARSVTLSSMAPTTPFATFTPVTPDYPTMPAITPATPLGTPTAPPSPTSGPTAELPPTPALPLDQALGQFTANALLYTNRNGFLMLGDGQHQVWLTANSSICNYESNDHQQGAWSHDGRFLAMICEYQNLSDVAILDLQTGLARRPDATGAAPVTWRYTNGWSPNDDILLISTVVGENSRVSAVDATAADAHEQVLLEVNAHDSLLLRAAWSPDGTQIAIYTGNGAHGTPGSSELFLINADGSNRRRFAPQVAGDQCHGVEWSRDGRFIYITAGAGIYCTQVSVDNGAQKYLNYVNGDQSPHWSPDGTQYAIREWPPGQIASAQATALVEARPHWSLYRADGTLIHAFADTPDDEVLDVAWMPDSRRLIVLAKRTDAEVEVIAVDPPGRQTSIATYATHERAGRLAVAPDGDLIAINVGARIVIIDTHGQQQAELEGQIVGWRPLSR
jgi:hypothetical protein